MAFRMVADPGDYLKPRGRSGAKAASCDRRVARPPSRPLGRRVQGCPRASLQIPRPAKHPPHHDASQDEPSPEE